MQLFVADTPGALEDVQTFHKRTAGAETNVAIGLARLGTEATWVSRLPRNPLGRLVAAHARAHGVDTSGVIWDDRGRLGLYFVEVAAPPRNSTALYDRAGSSFATLDPAELDWPARLAGARWLHTSGITPALSDHCAHAVREALSAARTAACRTSYDLNFRARLTGAAGARAALESIAGSIDLLVGSAEDAATVFGLAGEAGELARTLRARLGIPLVVVSQRTSAADGTQVRRSAAVGEDEHEVVSPQFRTVDPVGGGDAFVAGLLHGLLHEGPRRALELGGALAALKQSMTGDFAIVEADEVEQALAGAGAPRMAR
jgi:2-dehydro-3-deoxygluconokinase